MSPSRRERYEIRPFPRSRQLVLDAGWNGRRRPMIHGLVEFDVTEPRRRLRAHKTRTGETFSFTAFIIGCLGQAVEADRLLHAYRDWRGRLILFDEVDVLITIEVELDGRPFPMLHIIRAANRRSARAIHDEIRAVQAGPERSTLTGFLRWFPWLPTVARRLVYRAVDRSPHWHKQYAGTVGLTSVGMFGTGGGWGLSLPVHTLAVTLGGIAEQPGVVDGRIAIREYLSVTLSFNHDLIDGAPAARFAQRFQELVESGYGLADQG